MTGSNHSMDRETETDPLVLQNLEQFQDLKFGLMVHWGAYSVWGAVESWPIVDAEPYGRENLTAWDRAGHDVGKFMDSYFGLNQQFDPEYFDPESWAEAAADAGMKYLVFTTKHHDGFCLFDTAQTDYRTTHPSCPMHRRSNANVTKVLFDAFRKQGIRIGAYFSKADWHHPHYWNPQYPRLSREANYETAEHPFEWSQYVDFVHRQIEELLTGYGAVDILWLDSDWVRPIREDLQMPRLAELARKHQPGLIIVDRAVGGRYENYKTPEQKIPSEPMEGVWESCITMARQWSYNPSDEYQSARDLIHTLIRIVARGGNLLLNVGPGPDGRLPKEAIERMNEIGEWLAVNGSAIYGTRAVVSDPQGHFHLTKRKDTIYVMCLADEQQTSPRSVIHIPCPRNAKAVEMLGVIEPLSWDNSSHGITVRLTPSIMQSLPCQHAWTFAVTGAEIQPTKTL